MLTTPKIQHIQGHLGEYCPTLARPGVPSCRVEIGVPCPACAAWNLAGVTLGASIPLPSPNIKESGLSLEEQIDYRLAGRKIAIVEDNPTNLVYLTSLLKSFKEAILIAGNGKEALGLFGQHDIGLLLTDLVMPVMDGFTLLEELHETPRANSDPFGILVISQLEDWASTQRVIELGAGGYIKKPYKLVELLAKMDQALENIHYRIK